MAQDYTDLLFQEITGINSKLNNQNWTGSWMSGGENAAKEAAKLLTKKGVTSLSNLRAEPLYSSGTAVEMYQGQVVQTDAQGRKFINPYGYDSENPSSWQNIYLPPNAQTEIAGIKIDTYSGEGGEGSTTSYVPLTAEELKTYDPTKGTYQQKAGSKLVDITTGKTVAEKIGILGNDPSTFILDAYDTGNFIKGKDKSFGIRFENGVAVPFTTTERSGLTSEPLVMAALLAATGAGLGLFGGAGAGAAGTAGAGAAGAGLTGAELAIALGEGLVPIASTAGQAGVVGANLGALGAGIGLGGAAAGGAGALTGIDAMIAAGEGIVPITAEQVATAGLTQAELGALGSGIGLGGPGSGLLSSVGEYLSKNPNTLRTIAQLLGSGAASAIGSGIGGGSGNQGQLPTQDIPTNSPEYYQAIQNYYNTYLPDNNPNVGSYLADWYGGRFTQ